MSRLWSARGLMRPRSVVSLLVLGLLAAMVVSASSWSPVTPELRPLAEAPDEASAMAAAWRQGSRVEVASLRSESASTFANPDGTWTLEQSVGPVRVRRGAGWVPVDTSLTRAADGSWSTRATSAPVSVSGGGSGPLVRIAADGNGLALSWQGELPAPSVSGDTATYPDVLPGVDLRVRATDRGFGHEVVVKSREAAANPALARITFGLAAAGVRLSADPDGNLSTTDPSGATVFSAGAPLMWDSPAGDARRVERPVGVEVGSSTVALMPDQAMLADPTVSFPLVIDPQYSFHTPHAGASWTLLRRAHPTTSHWNLAPRDPDERVKGVARVGHAPDWPAAYLDRSVFQFDTNPVRGATIKSATFKIFQVWKHAHTCDANLVDPMVLHLTDMIGAGNTWNNPPVWRQALSSARSVPKLEHCAPDWVGMDARAGVQVAADNRSPVVTLGLKANDEGGDSGWKRFYVQNGTYPLLAITYNRKPGVSEVGTEPALAACRWCGGVPYVGATSMVLKGKVSDPDGGQVTAKWNIRRPTLETRQQTLASGLRFATPLNTGTLADGTTVTWDMQGTDGELSSAVVAGPKFVIDRTVPRQAPVVSAPLYRDDNRWHGGVGVSDTFTFTANPAAGEANDIDHYLWSWQDPPSAKVDAFGGLGGHASVILRPPGDGPRTLFVQSVDRAGNKSPTNAYRFYVRGGNGALAQWSFEGNAQDTAFLGDRHGTLNGPASYAPGAVGNSVRLDQGGTVTAPHAVRTDASFTVSAWVRVDDAVRDHTAVSETGSNTSAFQLGYRADNGGRWFFWMPATDTSVPGLVSAWSPQAAPMGTWTHLAGVYDTARGQIRLYVNGVLSATVAHRSTWSATGEVHIGNAWWNGAWQNHWVGAVDEVQLYDRVVTEAELTATVSRNNVQVAHWKFDEADTTGDPGTTARNAIDGGPMAVLTGGAAFTTDGAVNGAVALDGADGAVTTNEPVVRTDQSFSVAAWVKLDNVDTRTYTVLSQDGQHICGFCLQYEKVSDRWVFVMPRTDGSPPSSYDFVQSTAPPVAGTWTHLVGIYDAAAGKVRLYVDGVLAGEQARTASWRATGALQIGRERLAGNLGHFLDGSVDEVRVYSRAISADEIRGIVAQSNVTVGTWKLDGDPQDSSGMNRHGQLVGAPDWAAGQTSTPDPTDLGVRLTGNGAHISAPHAVDTDRSFSVSAWARVDQFGRQGAVVSQDGTNHSGFALRATAAGKWSFAKWWTDNSHTGANDVVGTAVQVGAWTHLVGVYSKDRGLLELYVNGVLAGSIAHTTGFNALGGVQIGRAKLSGQSTDYFTGAIDDVSVYSRTLLVDEIRTMAGRDLSLVHNWQLDEPSGTNAADSIGSRGGTLTGGATFAQGRVGNSVKLDGVNDAVATSGVDVRTDQSFTVAAWVYLDGADSAATAVSVDGRRTSKFRLGHVPADDQNPFGRWVFEMPEEDTDGAPVTLAALSTWESEVGAWAHLVGVYDAPSKMLWLYLNGERQNDGTLNTAWVGSGGLQVGRGLVAGAPDDYWPGAVDEVRMYTGALDKSRIEALYRSFPAPAAPPTLPVADAGLWSFDESAGSTVTDDSGQGVDATMRGGAGWIGGRKGPAGWFDGTTGYAETARPALNTGRSFSVTAWAYLSSTESPNRTVVGQDASHVSAFQVQYTAAANRWSVLVPNTDMVRPGNVQLMSTESAAAGEWTHLGVVYDADMHRLRLYVNGVLSAAKLGVTVLDSAGAFTIGRGKWDDRLTAFFPRGVDDVRAFGRALTDGEVRLVHDDVPPIGLNAWRFDDGTARDYLPRNNNATVTSGASFGPGISGTALRTDGVSGAATSTVRGVTLRDSFTVSAWARLDRADRVATVAAQDGTRMSGFVLQYRPESGRWIFGARVQDGDGAELGYAASHQPAVPNQWVHLAGVYDVAGQQLRLYVNGQLSGTRNHGALWSANGGFTIGRAKLDGLPAEFFQGAVDEVRAEQGLVADDEIARRASWPVPHTGVLGSYVNAAGDHRTASTDDPVPAGYRFERSLGLTAAPDQPGTQVLYACRTGADSFTSTDPACEGQVVLGTAGRVYTNPPTDILTVPIYRCSLRTDRFDSRHEDCGGGGAVREPLPLGHAVAYSPLVRYHSRLNGEHWATIDGTAPSYRQELVLGWTSLVPRPGTKPLMSCRSDADEFTSDDPACEGKQIIAPIGHVWTEAPADLVTEPLYRCVAGNQRFVSREPDCEGQTVDRPLGHVLIAAPSPTPPVETPGS